MIINSFGDLFIQLHNNSTDFNFKLLFILINYTFILSLSILISHVAYHLVELRLPVQTGPGRRYPPPYSDSGVGKTNLLSRFSTNEFTL